MSKLMEALDLKFDSDAGEGLTVRGYLRKLLLTLWGDGESFSAKRPFGNSGWDFELYAPLVKAGFIRGSIDADGYVEDVDDSSAEQFVADLIEEALKDTQP